MLTFPWHVVVCATTLVERNEEPVGSLYRKRTAKQLTLRLNPDTYDEQ